jgi:hypothetical protein
MLMEFGKGLFGAVFLSRSGGSLSLLIVAGVTG